MTTNQAEWLQLTLTVADHQVDEAEMQLWQLGAFSVTLLDAADQPIHEPDPGQTPLWPRLKIDALFQGDIDVERLSLSLLSTGLVDNSVLLQFNTLADRDWTRAWMDRFEPMKFGHDLWICPSHRTPDPAWQVVIKLDPGLAFGSGTHPTTALCLEWLSGRDVSDQTVIDYGCGSGVLAIAAALKGASSILAIDHDPQALSATLDNARRNEVIEQITVALPDQADDTPVDIVLANILAGPLVQLAPKLIALLRPGGRLILSGILAEQAEGVIAGYQHSLEFVSSDLREEWVRLVFKRTG